ncbi:MAG TPA: sugar nucleotide-binding protein [Candidatus Saccharimonadales bacterium]|nr:sugar nucleotide-binding protein [Candidatus Saccharimonadales bacterium]
MKLAIIGASSMIAQQAIEQFEGEKDVELIKADLSGENPIDLTNEQSVDEFFKTKDFTHAVLFSAYTDVNGAEKQRGEKEGICWKINVEGVKHTVNACKKYHKKLVFFSTDFVYDGTSGPYKEDDPVGPDMDKVSWYGITKIEAEKIIQENLETDSYLIIRISYPYSGVDTGKEDLVLRTLHYFKKEGKLYPMYDDQVITPTFIADIEPALQVLINKNKAGIYHLASAQTTTQYDFAKKLLTHYTGKSVELERGSLKEALAQEGSTPRPLNGGLNVEKIESEGVLVTNWEQGIEKVNTFG